MCPSEHGARTGRDATGQVPLIVLGAWAVLFVGIVPRHGDISFALGTSSGCWLRPWRFAHARKAAWHSQQCEALNLHRGRERGLDLVERTVRGVKLSDERHGAGEAVKVGDFGSDHAADELLELRLDTFYKKATDLFRTLVTCP